MQVRCKVEGDEVQHTHNSNCLGNPILKSKPITVKCDNEEESLGVDILYAVVPSVVK